MRGNRERDERQLRELAALGWKTVVVWECEVERDISVVRDNLLKEIGK